MDRKAAVKLVSKYTQKIKEHFSVHTVILFGSYARNKQKRDSDIDVAVIVNDNEMDVLNSSFLLFKLRRDIDLRIEPILFMKDQPDPSGFLEEIKRTGTIVYSSSDKKKRKFKAVISLKPGRVIRYQRTT